MAHKVTKKALPTSWQDYLLRVGFIDMSDYYTKEEIDKIKKWEKENRVGKCVDVRESWFMQDGVKTSIFYFHKFSLRLTIKQLFCKHTPPEHHDPFGFGPAHIACTKCGKLVKAEKEWTLKNE